MSDDRSVSAGVLPFMQHNQEIYFVLGRESFTRGWDGSLQWSEFGGQSKPSDNHFAWQTGAREFYEETLGVFGDIKLQLAEQQYAISVVVRRSGRRKSQKTYYLLEIPYQPDAQLQFYIRREQLKNIATTISRLRIIQRRLSAKQMPVPDYPYFIEQRLRLITDLERVEQTAQGAYLLFVTCQTDTVAIHIPELFVDDYVRLIYLKNWLDKQLTYLPNNLCEHAIIQKTWLPMVRNDFLEKEELNCFTLTQMEALIPNMRPGFILPLAIMLESMTQNNLTFDTTSKSHESGDNTIPQSPGSPDSAGATPTEHV
jgi:hypothetical protein